VRSNGAMKIIRVKPTELGDKTALPQTNHESHMTSVRVEDHALVCDVTQG